jgi:hypothetical protein
VTASPRLQIASLFAGYGVAGIFWGAFAASAPAFQAKVGLDPGAFGLALGAMTLAALPVMRLFGRVVPRVQAIAIPLCLGSFALGNLLLGVASGLPLFVAGLILLGGSSGALDIALNKDLCTIRDSVEIGVLISMLKRDWMILWTFFCKRVRAGSEKMMCSRRLMRCSTGQRFCQS